MTLSAVRGRSVFIIGGVLFALGLLLPLLVYPIFAIDLICFALAAVAFDLLLGFTGLLSFGHALFWGGAGYAATILIKNGHGNFATAVLLGVTYAAILALLVGLISIRRSGIYFAMITLAIAQIQFFAAFQAVDLTGGENGVQIPSRGWFFGVPLDNDRVYYYLVLTIVVLGTLFALRVVNSPFGAVLAAMRENEVRARSIGYTTSNFRLVAFIMSGTLAGLAGALYAIGNRLSGLDGVDWHTSGAIVMMTILGGIGTILGPIVGAGVFQSLEYYISKTAIGDKTNLVMGFVFAVVILIARRGIVGEILARTRRTQPIVELEEDDDPSDPAPVERGVAV